MRNCTLGSENWRKLGGSVKRFELSNKQTRTSEYQKPSVFDEKSIYNGKVSFLVLGTQHSNYILQKTLHCRMYYIIYYYRRFCVHEESPSSPSACSSDEGAQTVWGSLSIACQNDESVIFLHCKIVTIVYIRKSMK